MGGQYKILYKASVAKELRDIPQLQRSRIVKKILSLATDPRPAGSVKLSGSEDLYRVRQGEYRILYQIVDQELIVMVVKVGHRREVYRKA